MQCCGFVNHYANRRAARQRLCVAATVSLLLHVLVLLPAVARVERPHFERALSVRLQAAVGVDKQEASAAAPSVIAREASASSSRGQSLRPVQTPGAGEAGGAVAAPPAQGSAPTPTSALDATAGVVDGESLRAYRIALAVAVTRLRAQQANAGLRGEVVVEVAFGRGGSLVRVQRSSGNAVLDEQARSRVAQALAYAALPAGLAGQAFNLELPITFE